MWEWHIFIYTNLFLFNLIFLFLIGGTTYVFLSKKMKEPLKTRLIIVKFLLFITFLFLVYIFQNEASRFKEINVPSVHRDLSKILKDQNFKYEMKDIFNRTVSFKDHLYFEPGVKVYFNENL